MVDYEEDKTKILQIDVPPYARLLSIPDRPAVLEEVLEAIHGLPDGEISARSPYLEVKIQMTEPDTSYKYKIESALQGKSVRLARVVAVMPVQKESGLRAMKSYGGFVRWMWRSIIIKGDTKDRRCLLL